MTNIEVDAYHAQIRTARELAQLNETAKIIAECLRGIANSLNILTTTKVFEQERKATNSPYVIEDGIPVARR